MYTSMVSRLVPLYRGSAYGLPLEGFALAYPIVNDNNNDLLFHVLFVTKLVAMLTKPNDLCS